MSLRSAEYIYLDLYHQGQIEPPQDAQGVMADMAWIEQPDRDAYASENCLNLAFTLIGYENTNCHKKYADGEIFCLT